MLHDTETFPVLRTPRLDLVETVHAHAGDMFKLFSDKRVTEFYPMIPINDKNEMVPVIESFSIRFKEQQGIRWGIALKGSSAIIGTIGFHTYTEGHKASIVFALMPEYHGKGYASEAIQEVLKFGFEKLGLKRIEAEVMPGNTASEQVLVKTGFSYEGLLRDWMHWNKQYYDINMYSIVKDLSHPLQRRGEIT